MRSYDHRGRTRTQPQRAPQQPPAFRRDENRNDERYSFEERRSSFDERRARADRSDMGHDQGHATTNANPNAGAAPPEWFGRFNLADLQPQNRGHWARYDGLGMDEANANRGGHGQGHGHGQHYPDRTARGSAGGTSTFGPRSARRDVDLPPRASFLETPLFSFSSATIHPSILFVRLGLGLGLGAWIERCQVWTRSRYMGIGELVAPSERAGSINGLRMFQSLHMGKWNWKCLGWFR